jgi:hypothetical protein
LFSQVHGRATELAKRIHSSAEAPDGGFHPIAHSIESLRHSLAALRQLLATRHDNLPKN